jgi:hypothetical protein
MGQLVSRVPDYGNLDAFDAVFDGFRWLTLLPPFDHKRADREFANRLPVLASSMASSAAK